MKKLFCIVVASFAVSLTACAATQKDDQAASTVAGTSIAPLTDLYDSVWIKGDDGTVKTLDQVADDLSRYDVVFFGEFHGHSGIHLAQMRIFSALQQRNGNMTLSLEQFERDTQPLVDQYLKGEIGEKVLQELGRGWANYEQSYRPLVEFAKDNSLPVVASNAPKQAVICVSKKGPEIIDKIPMPDRLWVAKELHIEEGAYQDKYRSFIEGSSTHGPSSKNSEDSGEPEVCVDLAIDVKNQEGTVEAGKKDHKLATDKKDHMATAMSGEEELTVEEQKKADEQMAKMMETMIMKSFSSQVTRDDTMAESIAIHLKDNPDRKVLHLDGNFHSASHLGTVERLKLRMPELKIAVINPIAVADNNEPAWTDEDSATGDYILLVKQVPEMFVCEARELEFQRKTIMKRMGNKCIYSEETAQHEEKS